MIMTYPVDDGNVSQPWLGAVQCSGDVLQEPDLPELPAPGHARVPPMSEGAAHQDEFGLPAVPQRN